MAEKLRWRQTAEKCKIKHQFGDGQNAEQSKYLWSPDLAPVEPAQRTWIWYNFMNLWISGNLHQTAFKALRELPLTRLFHSLIQCQHMAARWELRGQWIGLVAGMALHLGRYTLTGIFVSLGGRMGAMYHIPFPVAIRSSFGVYGAIWPVLNRIVLAIIWYAVQSWIGGQHLYTIKAVTAPVGGIASAVWVAVIAGNGAGPVRSQSSSLKGSTLTWTLIQAIISFLDNFSTFILNDSDFTRFAKTHPMRYGRSWSQFLSPSLSLRSSAWLSRAAVLHCMAHHFEILLMSWSRAGLIFNLVGVAGAMGATIPIGAWYLYQFNFLTGVFVNGGVYYLMCAFGPFKIRCNESWNETGDAELTSSIMIHGVDPHVHDEEESVQAISVDVTEDDMRPVAQTVKH
ncbi:Allantoin permease [Exophiala sp. CCFEE 6388]|uniref:Allantoin permease n=1 Tax=Exophiala sideris TaxID=1016849 RepID=A0ABR0IUW9_9EURO|nr:Allantoin permease [Exophiala sideris]KAK5176030.1 Allantoin permease [Eurotiomycetes sp. CCFEE 6388]